MNVATLGRCLGGISPFVNDARLAESGKEKGLLQFCAVHFDVYEGLCCSDAL